MIKLARSLRSVRRVARALRRNNSGVMLIEFAYTLPLVLTIVMCGTELTNYATTQMSVGQVALQVADNASRMGNGSPLAAKEISEGDIDDVLTGGGLEFDRLGTFYRNGRIFLSSVEPDTTPGRTNKYKISWQRCRGSKTVASSYGLQGDNNLDGVGPTGQKITAPTGGAVMFVEVVYDYQPFFLDGFMDVRTLHSTSAMTVRDTRVLDHINAVAGLTASTCS